MNINTVNDSVRHFITRHFAQARTRALSDDHPLLESGIIDSMGVLDLVSFIESEFQITVVDEELIQEHFGSIGQIAAFIAHKQKE